MQKIFTSPKYRKNSIQKDGNKLYRKYSDNQWYKSRRRKNEAILKMESPKDSTGLKRILGMC